MYAALFALVFRRMDAERAHRLGFALIRLAGAAPGLRALLARVFATPDPVLRVEALGLSFRSPLVLAAGFDKDARGVGPLGMLGFAGVEIGTVTALPQPGNPRPRLFRLPADRALVNRMGFNNAGADAVSARLAGRAGRGRGRGRGRGPGPGAPVLGVNIGKSKVVQEDAAVADYVRSARALAPHADYLVVNVSSPNTPGLRNLQAVASLRPLLAAVRAALDEEGSRVPLLVKIAPDLADADVDDVADLALELGLDGIIATNTTISRDHLSTPAAQVGALGAGGLSGAPLADRSLEVLRRLHARVGGRVVLVAAGGIETGDDAWLRLVSGATLVQGYSGFVYGGPFWARRLQRRLADRLHDAGYSNVNEAVGSGITTR